MELRDKYIFILGLPKFNDKIESTIFTLARHLAEENFVFYIENPYTWKDLLLNRKKDGATRRVHFFSDNTEIDTEIPNLKVLVMPPMPSINWIPEGRIYRAFLKMNEAVMLRRVKDVIRKYKIPSYIFINSFNFYYPDLGRMLSPELLVYHCVDPLVFPVDKRHGIASERKIIEESHLVICTSKRLYDEKKKLNTNTYFIPNAADIKHSSKALLPELEVHEYLRNIPRPIIGYFGNIERRLDYALLDKITQVNPDKQFVFSGPISKEHVPLWFYERKNIHITGAVPYDQMPQVLKGFDIAMIPFKKDEVSATIFPLKLFEYLGAGKPVIATDFNPDLQEFTGPTVAYCSDAEAFSAAIHDSLSNDLQHYKDRRLAVAAQNTWEKRSREFGALINNYVLMKNAEKTGKHIAYEVTN